MANSCCGGTKVSVRRLKKTSCCGGSNGPHSPTAACCGAQTKPEESITPPAQSVCAGESCLTAKWITGKVASPVGEVPQVATTLSFADVIGSWKCRWTIGRMNYKVDPGLYAVGHPDSSSPVLVTSNYKMTFDRLREQLCGLNLWIMVLDTDGVNVWCAAGKGLFSTEEVIDRLAAVQLSRIVSHHTIILPQLGAVGVAAHEVTRQTGFRVVYGPVRAKDIQAFLANGMVATEKMRTATFPIGARAALTPVELVGAAVPLLITFGVLFILNATGLGHFGWVDLYGILGAVVVGAILTPILLPWIPGRAFSLKGALLGLLWAVGFLLLNGLPSMPAFGWLKAAAYALLLPALSGFLTMNFTGSSTFTSLSGVDREMKFAVPIMLFSAAGAVVLLLTSDLIRLFGGALV